MIHKLRLLFTFLIFSVGAGFFAGIQMEVANQGVFVPHELTCEEIIESGPGKNRFIEIGHFKTAGFCTQVGDEKGVSNCTYMPIFPFGENPKTADTVNLVLRVRGHLDQQSYREFWAEAIKKGTLLEGMCSSETYSLGAVEQGWPEKSVDAFIIDLDDKPSETAYWMGWCAYALAIVVSTIGTLFTIWNLQLPKNFFVPLGLACAGIALIIFSVSSFLQIPNEMLDPLVIMRKSGLLTAFGAGVGALLAAAASLLLGDRFHSLNVLGGSKFDVSDKTLTVTKGKAVKQFNFADIDCLTYTYDIDRQEVTKRKPRYRLNLQSNGKTFTSKGVLEKGQGPLLQRQLNPVFESITQRRVNQVLEGQSVSIAGWTFEGDTLIIPATKKKKPALQVPLNSFSKAAYASDHYQLWVKGEAQPVAKLPGSTEGAEILNGVLNHFVELQNNSTNDNIANPSQTSSLQEGSSPELSESPDDGTTIGNILFEDDTRHLHPVLIALIGLGLGIPLFYYVSVRMGVVSAALGIILAIAKVKNKQFGRLQFCVGEQGVSLNKNNQTTAMRYDALDSFAYQITHVYNKGVHVGDATTLKLSGATTDGKQEAVIDFVGDKNHQVYESVLSKATESVALNLTIALSEAPQVDWVSGKCSIHRDGIEANVSSGLSKSMEKVGYERIGLYKIEKEKLLICIDGDSSPKIKIDTKGANFYPGFYLFEKLLRLHRKSHGSPQSETTVDAVPV